MYIYFYINVYVLYLCFYLCFVERASPCDQFRATASAVLPYIRSNMNAFEFNISHAHRVKAISVLSFDFSCPVWAVFRSLRWFVWSPSVLRSSSTSSWKNKLPPIATTKTSDGVKSNDSCPFRSSSPQWSYEFTVTTEFILPKWWSSSLVVGRRRASIAFSQKSLKSLHKSSPPI